MRPFITLVLVWSVLLSAMQAPTHAQESTDYALIIGVSHFLDPKRCREIRYVEQDVPMAHEIATRFGFKPQNVIELKDADARSYRVADTLDDIGSKVRPGSRVLIYMSTHGTTQQGTNLPAVIMYDRALNQRELGYLTAKIRQKHARIFWLIDACFAPNVIRGVEDASTKFVMGGAPTRKIEPFPPDMGEAVITASLSTQHAWPTFVDDSRTEQASAYTLAFYRTLLFDPARVGKRFTYAYLDGEIAPYLDGRKDGRKAPVPEQDTARHGQPQEPWVKVASQGTLVFDRVPITGILADVDGSAVHLAAGRLAGLQPRNAVSLYAQGRCVGTVLITHVYDDFNAQGHIISRQGLIPPRCLAELSPDALKRLIVAKFVPSASGKAIAQTVVGSNPNIVEDAGLEPDAIVHAEKGGASVLLQPAGISIRIRGSSPQEIGARLADLLNSPLTDQMRRTRPQSSPSAFTLKSSFMLKLSSAKAEYALGDSASYTIEASQACSASLWDIDSVGEVTQLLPFGPQPGELKPNRPQHIPEGFQIHVSGTPGTDTLIAIACTTPADPEGGADSGTATEPAAYAIATLSVKINP